MLRNFLIEWSDVVAATAVMKNSDDGTVGTCHRADDAALGAALGTEGDNLHQHLVAMHGRTHGGRRNKYISRELCLEAFVKRGGIGGNESEAIAMHAQSSDYSVLACAGLRNRVAIRIELNQLTTASQTLQTLG